MSIIGILCSHSPPPVDENVTWMTMGESCVIKTGKGITKSDAVLGGNHPIISGGQAPMGYYHEYNREANNVTISRVGAYAGFVSFIQERFYVNDKCFSIIPKKSNIRPRFLFYILKNQEEQIKDLQSKAGVPTINTQKLSAIVIPIPPIEEQERIVGILDKFEALCTDLCEGLPAEIDARRRQYEHYRDRLLTFRRKSA